MKITRPQIVWLILMAFGWAAIWEGRSTDAVVLFASAMVVWALW
jgi:hypothetical protein